MEQLDDLPESMLVKLIMEANQAKDVLDLTKEGSENLFKIFMTLPDKLRSF